MTPGQVIEFAPRLAKKRAAECDHEHCEVDMSAADLSCADCGVALDPWWFLRQMADLDEGQRERERRHNEEQRAAFQKWCDSANATMCRLRAEIATLTATKNRLWNEQVGGKPLGAQVRQRRRARITPPVPMPDRPTALAMQPPLLQLAEEP